MATSTALWSFALVVGLLTLTPGLDTALILRTRLLGRPQRAWGVVLGIQSGTLVWGALTSLGVTALLTASAIAYDLLRWAGAGYLVWLGLRMIGDTLRGAAREEPSQATAPHVTDSLLGGVRQGMVTNLLNPKVGAFYVAVLPQFIPPGGDHLSLGLLFTLVHIGLALVWSTVLIGCARVLHRWLRTRRAQRLLDRVTGTVVAALGVRLAVSG
ncbi:LysE family translocator [Streptomyces sp. NPDC057702]|uniref:LysE family translocator n=1 Tax=unclassified Streptomyces TaxID=2593676 RepID=UPI0036957BFF